MPNTPLINYKTEANRYRYYYGRIFRFYQKPITQVSSAVLFTLILIIFFALFAIKPTLETIAELITKIETQQTVLAQAQKKVAALAVAQNQLTEISSAIPSLDKGIPNEYQLQSILQSIESLAGSLNISISNLRMTNIVYPLKPPTSQTVTVEEMLYSISFTATYSDAKILITNMNRLPRLFKVESITFNQPETQAQGFAPDTIQVTTQFKTFYLPSFDNR
jgi:Tfp pilus assembly protein PilO